MEKSIRQVYQEHTGKVSDKWSLYLDEWERLFAPYRNQQIQILEIGIQNGGSLEVWEKYFSNAKKIIGCDIDQKCADLRYEDDRITVIIGDANSSECEMDILKEASTFDIIIDDGSHKTSDVVRSFARYFPHLNENGLYLVEDLHSSYWKDFEGSLYNPLSSMAFFKRLADVVNYEHWRNNKSRVSLLTTFAANLGIDFEEYELTRIHSIEFLNSLCIIKKYPPDKNVLGKRIIVGIDGIVTKGWEKVNGTVIQDQAMDINDDANLDVFELIARTNILNGIVYENEEVIQSLSFQLEAREREIKLLTETVTQQKQGMLSLTTQVEEKDQSIQSLFTNLAEQDQSLQSLTALNEENKKAFQSMTAQIEARDQSIQTLNSQINQLNDKLDQINLEVVKYALSSSWRITRPLRKIAQFIKGKKNV